jgi:hypothetical protein
LSGVGRRPGAAQLTCFTTVHLVEEAKSHPIE